MTSWGIIGRLRYIDRGLFLRAICGFNSDLASARFFTHDHAFAVYGRCFLIRTCPFKERSRRCLRLYRRSHSIFCSDGYGQFGTDLEFRHLVGNGHRIYSFTLHFISKRSFTCDDCGPSNNTFDHTVIRNGSDLIITGCIFKNYITLIVGHRRFKRQCFTHSHRTGALFQFYCGNDYTLIAFILRSLLSQNDTPQ